jgi:thioredoxin 2
MMAPAYERAAEALEPQIRLAKLNTEEAQAIASRFNVSSIPTLVAFRRGREIARTSGALPFDRLVAWIRSAVAA